MKVDFLFLTLIENQLAFRYALIEIGLRPLLP